MKPATHIETARIILRRRAMHPNLSDEPRDCFCYAKVEEGDDR